MGEGARTAGGFAMSQAQQAQYFKARQVINFFKADGVIDYGERLMIQNNPLFGQAYQDSLLEETRQIMGFSPQTPGFGMPDGVAAIHGGGSYYPGYPVAPVYNNPISQFFGFMAGIFAGLFSFMFGGYPRPQNYYRQPDLHVQYSAQYRSVGNNAAPVASTAYDSGTALPPTRVNASEAAPAGIAGPDSTAGVRAPYTEPYARTERPYEDPLSSSLMADSPYEEPVPASVRAVRPYEAPIPTSGEPFAEPAPVARLNTGPQPPSYEDAIDPAARAVRPLQTKSSEAASTVSEPPKVSEASRKEAERKMLRDPRFIKYLHDEYKQKGFWRQDSTALTNAIIGWNGTIYAEKHGRVSEEPEAMSGLFSEITKASNDFWGNDTISSSDWEAVTTTYGVADY